MNKEFSPKIDLHKDDVLAYSIFLLRQEKLSDHLYVIIKSENYLKRFSISFGFCIYISPDLDFMFNLGRSLELVSL